MPRTKRISLLILMVTLTVSLSGCITFLTEIKIRGDGSGTMVQTMTINPETMKQAMESIAKEMGATPAETKPDSKNDAPKTTEGPFKTEDLKGKAADLGQGVTFVSAEPIDTKTAAGIRVTYAFKDINQMAVNPKPEAAMGTAAAGASSPDSLKFRFTKLPNGNAVLTIALPKPKPEPAKEEPKPEASAPEQTAQQMEMVRQMFKGLHMGVSISVEGKVVKTNSPYLDGSKVTLMDIDFDPLLSDQDGIKALQRMEKAKGDDIKTLEALKGIKGLKITTEPEVSIEFAPK